MTRRFLVPLLLPADPAVALEAAPKQYVDARAVPAGGAAGQHLAKASATDYALTWADPPTSGAGDQFTYSWKTTTTAVDPTAGGVKVNTADPTVATAVYISMYASDGVASLWLLDLQVGMRFTLYKPGDVNTFIRYQVSGTPINNANTWFNIPVTLHEEGTTGFSANNNQAVQVGPARTSVAAITNADLADMATNTIKGRRTAGTGDPEDLTPSQARAVIASDSGGGTTNFFRADGTFAAPPAGGGGITEAEADTRYVNVAGDTMTGTLNWQAGGTQVARIISDDGDNGAEIALLHTDGKRYVNLAVWRDPGGDGNGWLTLDSTDLGKVYLEAGNVARVNVSYYVGGTPMDRVSLQGTATSGAISVSDGTRYIQLDAVASGAYVNLSPGGQYRIDGVALNAGHVGALSATANDIITNAKLANMAGGTLKGNATGGSADPSDLSVTEVKTMLGIDNITVSNTAPSSPAVGDLWVDTT